MEIQSSDLVNVVKLAREAAILGEYETARIKYLQALTLIESATNQSGYDQHLTSKWKLLNDKIKSEMNIT